MPPKEYAKLLRHELAERTEQVVKERTDADKGFASKDALRKITPGAKPSSTKTANRDSHRPLVFASTPELRREMLEWYFDLVTRYKAASKKFRAGDLHVQFPRGTYRPFLPA